MFRNVVVGIRDVESGPDAIALAGQLVAAGGGLTLVHVCEVADIPAPGPGAGRAVPWHQLWRERLARLADACAVSAAVGCVDAHSPRRGLHLFVTDAHADLLVVRTTARDEVERDLVEDDARRILEAAPCAVAVAPAGYGNRHASIKRIGVAFDGSRESLRALDTARALAKERDAELSAFEVVTAPVYAHDSSEMRHEIERSVTEARERIATLGDVEADAGFGHHVDELARYAASVDLLILGAHRTTLGDRVLERSTAQRLADVAPSPLLVLASAAESSRR